jgi:glycosyltransferase involved in cell wall biosynthesis
MTKLTFVIPVAGYHQDVAHQAVESVKAQTIPCELIVIQDTDGRGAGYARNRGLEQCQTEYICFLDADDTIDPKFAEITLGILDHYMQSGRGDSRYIYTDWLGIQNSIHKAPEPCDAWTNGTFHLVTTVLPVDRVRLIGGFDEVMTGIEDTDFYVRLRLSGVCGIHVNAPLVHYREGGQRSISARQSGEETAAKL